jgi:hypothetical protein
MKEYMNCTEVIVSVISFVFTLIAVFVVPKVMELIKTKLTDGQLDTLYNIASIAVRCAEVTFGGKKGEEKYNYCLNYIKEFCNSKNWDFDIETIKACIQSNWLEYFAHDKNEEDVSGAKISE